MKLSTPQLSSLEIHYIAKELQNLLNSKVDKIFHPEEKQLILQMHKTGLGKNLLKFKIPEYLCITQVKESVHEPSQFCVYLRKKLGNSFLESVKQIDFERIIEMKFNTKEEQLSLIIELFTPGNIILAKEGKIISALWNQEYKDRKIKPKEEYKHPTREINFLELKEEELNQLLKKTDKSSIVKTLAMDLGLGGVFAEEACFNAGIDKNEKSSEIKKIKELFTSLQNLKERDIQPSKTDEEIIPFVLNSKNCEKLTSTSFLQAIDDKTKSEISTEERIFETKYKEKLKKIDNMVKNQESTIKKLTETEKELKEKGDKIYENFQKIEQILKELKEKPTKEILQKLKEEKKIKDYDLKEKTITVEIG